MYINNKTKFIRKIKSSKMTASSYFTVSCDSYKQIIFSGFTRLQERQEFVDLTLAADGHIVKVHKNIMALASPYIKELLKSTSSDNPVIFLNNVKHNVLKYLLEYIYQGEVSLPHDCIEPFFQLSQSLHITGMRKRNTSNDVQQSEHVNQNPETSIPQQPVQRWPTSTLEHANIGTCNNNEGTSNIAACITINSDHNFEVRQFENVQMPNIEDNYPSNLDKGDSHAINADTIKAMPIVVDNFPSVNDAGNMVIDVKLHQGDHTNTLVETTQTNVLPTIQVINEATMGIDSEETALIDLNMPINLNQEAKDALKKITQYTVTERGSVQIIVSRYMYCSHHSARGGRKHRWRCIDYRKHRCPAFIDSLDYCITSRKGLHNHGFHDDKIYKKHQKGGIFHSYKQAKESWLPAQTDNKKYDWDSEEN